MSLANRKQHSKSVLFILYEIKIKFFFFYIQLHFVLFVHFQLLLRQRSEL